MHQMANFPGNVANTAYAFPFPFCTNFINSVKQPTKDYGSNVQMLGINRSCSFICLFVSFCFVFLPLNYSAIFSEYSGCKWLLSEINKALYIP